MFEYVKDLKLQPARSLAKRSATRGIVIHHFASDASVQAVHKDAIDRLGWAAIGYNVIVQLDGVIVWGRGLDMIGAHAGRTQQGNPDYANATTNNTETIGVAFQGNYSIRKEMPKAQYEAGVRLIRDLLMAYPGAWIRGHGEMPATATECPGKYFPLAQFKALAAPLYPTLQRGDTGEAVKRMQEWLIAHGYAPLGGADGKFGAETDKAVRAFQAAMGLKVDGICGPLTWAALLAEPAAKVIYRVQVGAYTVRANAERMRDELKSKGYDALIVEVVP